MTESAQAPKRVHYRTLSPTDYLCAADFVQPREVTISRVDREQMPQRDGDKPESGVFLYVATKDGAEHPKPLKLGGTMVYALSLLHGEFKDDWPGRKVTLYRTHCLSFGEVEECVRVQVSGEQRKKILARLKKRKVSVKTWECDGVNNGQ